jgi:hypothetical protein
MSPKRGALTYLYCLVRRPTRPPLAGAPRGLPGAGRPRALDAGGGVWGVVADAPRRRYDAGPIERGLRDLDWVAACAVAHESVVEHAARAGVVVPVRLFTLFDDDARALAHIAALRPRLDRLFDRLRGRQEWGVRVLVEPAHAHRRARSRALRETAGMTAGRRFLLVKQRERDAVRALAVGGRGEAQAVYAALAARAERARRRSSRRGEGRLLLDAAFLVDARGTARFRDAARRAAARLAGLGLALTLSGPWPPYSFVDAR